MQKINVKITAICNANVNFWKSTFWQPWTGEFVFNYFTFWIWESWFNTKGVALSCIIAASCSGCFYSPWKRKARWFCWNTSLLSKALNLDLFAQFCIRNCSLQVAMIPSISGYDRASFSKRRCSVNKI